MLIGVVGKPSSGKSTFFKAATLAEVEIANYPFTTIKPNHGTGFVKVQCVDKEFNTTCNPRFGYCDNGTRFVPVELLDVAGLVPGAHEGKGMGNQFLDDLNQADVLVHIIDVSGSTNEKGEPVETLSYNPAEDIRFLEHELNMWYLRLIKKGWEDLVKLRVTEELIEDTLKKLDFDENISDWDEEKLKTIATELRKKTKPMIIACNKADVPGAEKNFEKIRQEFPDHLLIPCSAESELALKEAAKHELIRYIPGKDTFEIKNPEKITEKQKKALDFIKSNVLEKFKTTGVQQVLDKAIFELLEYVAIFPGGVNKLEDKDGNRLPDCFLLPPKTTALDFAYHLHTDIGDGFIKAIDVRTKKPVGKEHVLKNRDVIEIATKA